METAALRQDSLRRWAWSNYRGGKGSTVLRPRTDVSATKPLGATSTNGHAKAAAGMVQVAGLLGRIPVVCI